MLFEPADAVPRQFYYYIFVLFCLFVDPVHTAILFVCVNCYIYTAEKFGYCYLVYIEKEDA